METGQLTQTAIDIIQWSWNIIENIWSSFESESFFSTIFQNDARFRSAMIIFLLWISALIRVIKDSSSRSSSFRFQLLSAMIIILFTPIFWIILYIAIRPKWVKRDKTPRRDALLQQIQLCENCWELNNIQHSYCTNCWESLQTSCRECQNKYSISYSYCPNCWAPSLEE